MIINGNFKTAKERKIEEEAERAETPLQLTPSEIGILYNLRSMDEETRCQFERFAEALVNKNDITRALLKRFDKGRLTSKQLLAYF